MEIFAGTGYYPIRNAARELNDKFVGERNKFANRVECLIKNNVLPEYFRDIPSKLNKMNNSHGRTLETDATVLVAGGTDLFVQKPNDLLDGELKYLSDIKKLKYIKEQNRYICIGADTTVEEFRNSKIVEKYFPSLRKDLLLVSSMIMRNKATLTGNIVNASPIGDLTIILLVLKAELVLLKDNQSREVYLSEFFKGYKTFDLKCREIIKEIKIPIPSGNYKFSFEKVSNRKYLDIAACNSAFFVDICDDKISDIRISAGGVAPIPMLLDKTVKKLLNKKIKKIEFDGIKKIILSEVNPIDDVRGTAEYKKLLLMQLIYAHLTKIFPEVFDAEAR